MAENCEFYDFIIAIDTFYDYGCIFYISFEARISTAKSPVVVDDVGDYESSIMVDSGM